MRKSTVRSQKEAKAVTPATEYTPQARLRVEQPAKVNGAGTYRPRQHFGKERDAYMIPLRKKATWIDLIDSR